MVSDQSEKNVQSLELCHLNQYAVNKKTEMVMNGRPEGMCIYLRMALRDCTYAEKSLESWR